MRRIYGLTTREQLMVYSTLREYLGSEVGEETVLDKQVKDREEALAVMRQVAAYYHLPAGQAPKVTQHREAPQSVTGEWTASKVIRAWGRYRFAQKAYEGKEIPEAPAKRAIRRLSSGKAHEPETYINAVRHWLATNPKSLAFPDYNAYVAQYNSELLTGQREGRALSSAEATKKGLGLLWSQILTLAKGDATYDELRREYVKERVAKRKQGALNIVSASQVAQLLSCRPRKVATLNEKPGFPVPVLRLGKANGWYKTDILDYRAGRKFPKREFNELRPLVLSSEELAALLKITGHGLRTVLKKKGQSIPPPDGQVSTGHYWLKDKTEAWITTNRPRKRKRRSR